MGKPRCYPTTELLEGVSCHWRAHRAHAPWGCMHRHWGPDWRGSRGVGGAEGCAADVAGAAAAGGAGWPETAGVAAEPAA